MSKNDMVIGLLPCPHCGRKEHEFHRYSRKIGFDVFYCIRCYCCAETIGQTESEAEQSWNTRVEPAQQHQGEPVALPARMQESTSFYPTGWNACLDEIAKLGPLYTHPAPAVQQEPVAWLYEDNERSRGTPFRVIVRESRWIELQGDPRFTELPLYTHADPAEK